MCLINYARIVFTLPLRKSKYKPVLYVLYSHSTPSLESVKMFLQLFSSLLLFLSYLQAVQSCTTVTGLREATLRGVCPNDTLIVPVGRTLSYNCYVNRVVPYIHHFAWNISGQYYNYNPNLSNIVIDSLSTLSGVTTLHFTPQEPGITYIQCIMCNYTFSCVTPTEYIATEPVQAAAFGK